ncbi:MAG: hypothetical protein ACRDNW_15160 [Trebonia sp.]
MRLSVASLGLSFATRGPFLIWLRSPELAEKVDALGAYCRFGSHIDERLRELSSLRPWCLPGVWGRASRRLAVLACVRVFHRHLGEQPLRPALSRHSMPLTRLNGTQTRRVPGIIRTVSR